MDNMNAKFNRKSQNNDEDQEAPSKTELDLDIFRPLGRPLGKSTLHLSLEEFQQAHLYVLRNCDEIIEFSSKCSLFLSL